MERILQIGHLAPYGFLAHAEQGHEVAQRHRPVVGQKRRAEQCAGTVGAGHAVSFQAPTGVSRRGANRPVRLSQISTGMVRKGGTPAAMVTRVVRRDQPNERAATNATAW